MDFWFPSEITPDLVASSMGGSFALGVVCSSWSIGLSFYIAFMLVYELWVYLVYVDTNRKYNFEYRVVINFAYFFGWVLGRTMGGRDVYNSAFESAALNSHLINSDSLCKLKF